MAKVEPDSAAAHAGLKPGDVILKYNGSSIADAGQLSARVSMTAPGEHATLEIWRDGKPMSLGVTIGSAREMDRGQSHARPHADAAHLGLTVRPLTPEEREQAGVSQRAGGRRCRRAAPRRPASSRATSCCRSMARRCTALTELRELVHQHDKQVALLIQRGDSRIFVPVELG